MTRKPIGMSYLIGVVSQEGLRNSFSMHGFYARFESRVAGMHCAFRVQTRSQGSPLPALRSEPWEPGCFS